MIFLLGVVFAFIVVPLLQVLSDLLFTVNEVLKAKMSVFIAKLNNEIQKINSELEQNETVAIGFQVPNETEN